MREWMRFTILALLAIVPTGCGDSTSSGDDLDAQTDVVYDLAIDSNFDTAADSDSDSTVDLTDDTDGDRATDFGTDITADAFSDTFSDLSEDADAPIEPVLVPLAESVAFSIDVGLSPAPRNVVIDYANTDGYSGTLQWTAVEQTDVAWLELVTTTGFDGDVLTLGVSSADLAVDVYTAVVEVSDPEASNSPVHIEVTLEVWAPQSLGTAGRDRCCIDSRNVLRDDDGWHALWAEWDADYSSFLFIASSETGSTWDEPELINTLPPSASNHHIQWPSNSLVRDSAGAFHVVYEYRDGQNFPPSQFGYVTDASGDWVDQHPFMSDATFHTGHSYLYEVQLWADASDTIHLVTHDYAWSTSNYYLIWNTHPSGGSWGTPTAIETHTSGSDRYQIQAVMYDGNVATNTAHAVYIDQVSGEIFVKTWNGTEWADRQLVQATGWGTTSAGGHQLGSGAMIGDVFQGVLFHCIANRDYGDTFYITNAGDGWSATSINLGVTGASLAGAQLVATSDGAYVFYGDGSTVELATITGGVVTTETLYTPPESVTRVAVFGADRNDPGIILVEETGPEGVTTLRSLCTGR